MTKFWCHYHNRLWELGHSAEELEVTVIPSTLFLCFVIKILNYPIKMKLCICSKFSTLQSAVSTFSNWDLPIKSVTNRGRNIKPIRRLWWYLLIVASEAYHSLMIIWALPRVWCRRSSGSRLTVCCERWSLSLDFPKSLMCIWNCLYGSILPWHCRIDTAPLSGVMASWGHWQHEVMPSDSWKYPIGHGRQGGNPLCDIYPGAQGTEMEICEKVLQVT